ncbi:MAG: pentapeptide repeat-containing protein [Acaryochloridaceae cyanobacterium RL_2_7]|nr:pentapeptide repeat-containing protein [Acaryochloridaceae cyanobacterium RL_2_7]
MGFVLCLLILVFLWLNLWARPAWANDFDRVNLSNSDFHGQDLRGSSYTFTNLRNTDLSHTNLSGVSLFGSKFRGANLEGADLSYATLDSAELVKTNLNNANLEGAFAHSAQFEGATIVGADFTDVDLRSDAQAMLCEIAEGTNPVTHRETRETLYCD